MDIEEFSYPSPPEEKPAQKGNWHPVVVALIVIVAVALYFTPYNYFDKSLSGGIFANKGIVTRVDEEQSIFAVQLKDDKGVTGTCLYLKGSLPSTIRLGQAVLVGYRSDGGLTTVAEQEIPKVEVSFKEHGNLLFNLLIDSMILIDVPADNYEIVNVDTDFAELRYFVTKNHESS